MTRHGSETGSMPVSASTKVSFCAGVSLKEAKVPVRVQRKRASLRCSSRSATQTESTASTNGTTFVVWMYLSPSSSAGEALIPTTSGHQSG